MAIHFVCGKPGGGKTLYAVKLILDEIVAGHRDIITNVAIKLPELNAYIQERFPRAFQRYIVDSGRTISDRIKIIDEDQLRTFYVNRGNGVILPMVSVPGEREQVPDYKQANDGGVFYVLDEIHIAFNARSWASTGKQVLYYLSQHRKMGDDVICVTQAVGNVDKQFRSVAQDYTYVRNLSKARFGMFRFPGIFHRSTYPSVPMDASKAMVEATFTLDVRGIASVYDTAKGVGIHGRSGADTKERKKGLPFSVLLCLIGLSLYFFFFILPKILKWYFNPARIVPHVQKVDTALSGVGPGAPSSSTTPGTYGVFSTTSPMQFHLHDTPFAGPVAGISSASATVPVVVGGSPDDTNTVYCVGYSLLAGEAECYFSDGTTAYGRDGEIQEVRHNWVTAWGRKFRVVRGVASFQVADSRSQSVTMPASPALSVAGNTKSPDDQADSGVVSVLPSIHGNYDGLEKPQPLNGISAMQSPSAVGRGSATY